jgi:phage-related protein (TIGR01555 family)
VASLHRQREREDRHTTHKPIVDLYATDGLAALIVDRPAEDALSRGFVVEGDKEKAVQNEIDRLDAITALTDAARWSRLHGGGVILPLVDDRLTLDQPIGIDNIRQINDLKVYPVSAITASAVRYTDERLANYGEPIFYTIQPPSGLPFPVHESRLLRVPGEPLAYAQSVGREIPWIGRSAIEGCREDLGRYREALRLIKEILRRKQQAVYKMKGMAETMAIREFDADGSMRFDGKALVMDRLNLTDAVRGTETTIGVDGEDDFTVLDASVSGLDAVLAGYRIALAASSGIPVPILFGEGLSGLGNSGSGEQSIYHGRVRQVQERSLRPALERLVSLIWAQSEVRAREPEGWRITFNPLWSPSEKEVADAENVRATAWKTRAEALIALGDAQVMLPEEVRGYAAKQWPELGIRGGTEPVRLPDDDAAPEA